MKPDNSRKGLRTLVVGGEYAELDGVPHVPERCWRMVRIFSDNLVRPTFARRRDFSGETSLYSARFPCRVIPARGTRPVNVVTWVKLPTHPL